MHTQTQADARANVERHFHNSRDTAFSAVVSFREEEKIFIGLPSSKSRLWKLYTLQLKKMKATA